MGASSVSRRVSTLKERKREIERNMREKWHLINETGEWRTFKAFETGHNEVSLHAIAAVPMLIVVRNDPTVSGEARRAPAVSDAASRHSKENSDENALTHGRGPIRKSAALGEGGNKAGGRAPHG